MMADLIRTRELARLRKQRQRHRERDRERDGKGRAKGPTHSLYVPISSSSEISTGPNSTKTEAKRRGGRTDRQMVIPWWWMDRLRRGRYRSSVWVTALVVWYWHTQRQRLSFWMSSTDIFPQCEMSRYAIRRALNQLRDAVLIHVFRRHGWMPWVTVVAEELNGRTNGVTPLRHADCGSASPFVETHG
jgi:hypothetical protein